MTKRKHFDETAEAVDSVFNLIFDAMSEKNDSISGTRTTWLQQLKSRLLSDLSAAGGGKEVKKAAKEFTIADAVESFGLKYTTVRSESSEKHFWRIEELPETQPLVLVSNLNSAITTNGKISNSIAH
jgi:hypothetical protein